MGKDKCYRKGCKTIVEVDTTKNIPFLNATVVNFCDKHWIEIRKQRDLFDSLVTKYNKMKIMNNGKPRVFTSGTDLSNYLIINDKAQFNKIIRTIK